MFIFSLKYNALFLTKQEYCCILLGIEGSQKADKIHSVKSWAAKEKLEEWQSIAVPRVLLTNVNTVIGV